jgi:tetratricopeptide (TPR) repeat protein
MTAIASAGRDVELLRALADRIEQHDPGAFNNLGVLYFSKGLMGEAVAAFLRALSLDPRMRTAARNLEIAAAEPGACAAPLAQFDDALLRDPDDADTARQRARLLRLIGRRDEAVAALDALIASNPDDAVSLFERGLIEQRAGDLRRAQRWFERAANAAPGDTITALHLAEVLYHRGQNEQSLDALDALLAKSPDMADAHLLRGFVLGDMGRHDAGLAAAKRAAVLNPSLAALQPNLSLDSITRTAAASNAGPTMLTVEPDSGMARYGLGLAFRQRGYFAEARREFGRAIENGEDARLSAHAIAELDLLAGEHARACAAYDALLAIAPEDARYWNERGVALHQGGDLDRAAESYRRALRADPHCAVAYNNLGVALADAGESAAAREALQRAAGIDVALVCARLNLARWHGQHANPLAALAMLRELLAFHPTNAESWHELGLALVALHRPAEAREAFVRAIEHRPDHAEARYSLAEVLGELGDADGALRETQHALGLSSMRRYSRLAVAIDLQRECPEAAGRLDLLALGGGTPLTGVRIDDASVASLLPEQGPNAGQVVATAERGATHVAECDIADTFAARGLHGEALERYRRVRLASEADVDTGPGARALWRRAAVGETRSECLLGEGHAALPLLRRLGAESPRDPEILALFACGSASASRGGDSLADDARTAMLRLLRLESSSAALLHFVGDAAVAIGDEPLALGFYRRALALDPTRPSPRVAIAALLRRRGDLLAARLELVAALASNPSWRDAVLELARVHRDGGRPLDALEVLTRYLGDNATDIEGLVLLADILVTLERDEDARIAVSRVLRHAPDDNGALWCAGLLLARQGRLRDAAVQWRRIVDGEIADEFTERAAHALSQTASHERQPETRMTA